MQNEDKISDDGSHELDKVILVQSLEQESVGKEDHVELTQEQKHGDSKKDKDEGKIEPIVQTEGDGIETIRIDQEEAKPIQDSKMETDSKKTIEKAKTDGDKVKSEETKRVEKDEEPLVGTEKVLVQDPSPIPNPGSKNEKETSVAKDSEVVEVIDGGKEDDKPPQVDKPAELVPPESSNDIDIEDPSSQDLNKSRSSQHHSDPTAMPSHPLKPLPSIDDGITETKSEPRLPLLPPIGSKKIATLQSNSGALKSQSATGIVTNTAAPKDQSKGPSEKGKERERVPSSSNQSTTKKKRSTDTLRSTSGSSISKSKKSSSSNSTVSLGPKSKSRESLKSGPQNRLTATSRSSDNLANGAAKKLSISRESLKAASQVYSSAPATKSGEVVKKGDSGRSQSSKSKETVKAEKERKSSDQKPPDKAEMVAGVSGKAKEEVSESNTIEKNKNSDDSNQDATTKKETDLDVKGTTLPATLVEEQSKESNKQSTKKEEINEVVVTVSTPEKQTTTSEQTKDATPKEDKSTKGDKEASGDTGESSDAKEVKNEALGESDKAEPASTSDDAVEREQAKAQEKNEDSPPANPDKESDSKTDSEKESNEAPAPSTTAKVEVKVEDTKATVKDDASDNTKPQGDIDAKEIIPKSQPKDLKEQPAGHVHGEDTMSQISSSEFASKLEIDKKTGQSEQSIVEAVEKSTDPITTTTRDIPTPA